MTRRKQKPDYDWSGTTWDGMIIEPDFEKLESGQMSRQELENLGKRKDYEMYHLNRESWNKLHAKKARKP